MLQFSNNFYELSNKFYQLKLAESDGRVATFSYRGQPLLAEKQPPLFRLRFRTEQGDAVCCNAERIAV